MDAIHKRYVSYLNQSLTQRDATKTDYTYAKSYSYRRRMDVSMMNEWSVPNMCRISLNSLRNAIKIFDSLSAISKVDTPSNQFMTAVIKSLKFGEFSIVDLKTELLSEDCVTDNQKNAKSLKSKRLKRYKRKSNNLVSIYFILLLLIFFVAIIWLFWFNPSISSSSEDILQERESETQYMFCYSLEKPDPKPKAGVLQLVSTISKHRLNSYTSLYRFKETRDYGD